jgi:hypothetical protein
MSFLVLMLLLLGSVTACTSKTMSDQHTQTQDNSGSAGGGMGGGAGGGGGGY